MSLSNRPDSESILMLSVVIILLLCLSICIWMACKRPPASVGRALTKKEQAVHNRLMRKHGEENTRIVVVPYKGSPYYYMQDGRKARFI